MPKKIGAIAIKEFALLVMLGAAQLGAARFEKQSKQPVILYLI